MTHIHTHIQADGYGDSMTDQARRTDSVKIYFIPRERGLGEQNLNGCESWPALWAVHSRFIK